MRSFTDFEPINLDGLGASDLDALEPVFNLYQLYCYHKSLAMRFRAAGDIANAVRHEKICEHNYKRMPDWARW